MLGTFLIGRCARGAGAAMLFCAALLVADAAHGIHGTPDPQSICRTQSHGCVHLTNWDAQALAKMVHRGTKVEFIN